MKVIYGVPLTRKASKLIESWSASGDPRYWEKGTTVCGFDGGYCGVKLGQYDDDADYVRVEIEDGQVIIHYYPREPVTNIKDALTRINLRPPNSLADKAERMVDDLHNELRDKCPELGVYIITS